MRLRDLHANACSVPPPLPEPDPSGGKTTVHANSNPGEAPDAHAGPPRPLKGRPALQRALAPRPRTTSVSPVGTLRLPQSMLVTPHLQDGPTFKDTFFTSFKVACFLT